MTIAYVPRPEPGPDVRPPAVAGAFYPAQPEDIRSELQQMFPIGRSRRPGPA